MTQEQAGDAPRARPQQHGPKLSTCLPDGPRHARSPDARAPTFASTPRDGDAPRARPQQHGPKLLTCLPDRPRPGRSLDVRSQRSPRHLELATQQRLGLPCPSEPSALKAADRTPPPCSRRRSSRPDSTSKTRAVSRRFLRRRGASARLRWQRPRPLAVAAGIFPRRPLELARRFLAARAAVYCSGAAGQWNLQCCGFGGCGGWRFPNAGVVVSVACPYGVVGQDGVVVGVAGLCQRIVVSAAVMGIGQVHRLQEDCCCIHSFETLSQTADKHMSASERHLNRQAGVQVSGRSHDATERFGRDLGPRHVRRRSSSTGWASSEVPTRWPTALSERHPLRLDAQHCDGVKEFRVLQHPRGPRVLRAPECRRRHRNRGPGQQQRAHLQKARGLPPAATTSLRRGF